LLEKGIESYCPLNKVKKKWSDRIKLVEEPLFKSYVFVKLSEDEKTSVRYINGVVNFVYWLGKPAIIRNREIERIRQFLNEYTNVTVEPLELQPGTKVIIKAGVMMDKEAKVVKDRRTYVEVEIESLGCKLKALIQKKHMDLIP
ncbi:MAG: UpxY family transcription antiterminator, partial [Pedobacter agri]